MFGRPVFPRGAYLSGRLEEFRDPGHFVGKGRLKLEFVSLTVPGGTLPLSARMVSVPHYRVDAEGYIQGRGHARRDALEWTIPILWPEKIISLPMRGPRPTLKGETPILLRILDDLSIPADERVVAEERISPNAGAGKTVLEPELKCEFKFHGQHIPQNRVWRCEQTRGGIGTFVAWAFSLHREYEQRRNVFADRAPVALTLADAADPQGRPGLPCNELLGRGRPTHLRQPGWDATGPCAGRSRFADDFQT
jgi:hypothetical protein